MGWLRTLGRGLQRAIAWGWVVLLCGSLAIAGCSQEPVSLTAAATAKPSPGKLVGAIAEVAPPVLVQRLHRDLDRYQPQVEIIAPRPDELVTQTEATVQLRVRDLPLFKDQALALGPHVTVMLDDRRVAEVFDANEAIALTDLTPGTHTLRAFAERPWHESFKNDGAFAQSTFHVFAQTRDRAPDPDQPLLTYNQPIGAVGTEPVLLDFYLTNAPLHLLARERDDDEIRDWKIRATINGDSFVLDDWQSVYLKGFRRGTNWVKLELIDDRGEPITNAFNEVVALVDYNPNQSSTLDRLIKGDLPEAEARAIIDPNYKPLTPAPEPTPEPTPEPVELIAPEPEPIAPPSANPEPAAVESPTEPEPTALPEPEPVAEPAPAIAPVAEPESGDDAAIEASEPDEAIAQPSPIADESVESPAADQVLTAAPAEATLEESEPEESAAEEFTAEELEPEESQEPIASPEPAPAPVVEPVTEAAPEPEPLEIDWLITPEAAPVVESAIAPAPPPSATAEPTQPKAKPLTGVRRQLLKWLKETQQNLPDDLNLPFDIKQLPIPSAD